VSVIEERLVVTWCVCVLVCACMCLYVRGGSGGGRDRSNNMVSSLCMKEAMLPA